MSRMAGMVLRLRFVVASMLVAAGVVFATPSAAQAFPSGQCLAGHVPGPNQDVTIAGTNVRAHLVWPCNWLDNLQSWRHMGGELYLHGSVGLLYYFNGELKWSSSRNEDSVASQMLLQGDGNLVLYGPGYRKALWASHTRDRCGFNETVLAMQSDGNLVLYCLDHTGAPGPVDALWSSRNARPPLALNNS